MSSIDVHQRGSGKNARFQCAQSSVTACVRRVRALTRDARKAPSRIELQRTVDRIELNELDDELRIGHAMLSSPENARSAEPLRERIA